MTPRHIQRVWAETKTTEFPPLGGTLTAVLPVGSTEQHGPHLPVGVDTMLAGAVAQGAAEIAGAVRPVSVLPALWVSLADHHMAFPGTLTLDFGTFAAVLRCVVRSLRRQGVGRVLLLNAHGGNRAALTVIVNEVSAELDVPLAAATYWEAAGPAFAAILEGQPGLRHACEAETSMMLALSPDLVDMALAEAVAAPADGLAGARLQRWTPVERESPSGVIGVPRLATAEKGWRLLQAAAEAVAALLLDDGLWTGGTP